MDVSGFLLEVEHVTISGQLYLPGEKASYPAVGICHGIPSGKPGDPNDGGYPALAERICREGFAACVFNFRGSGESGGNLDLPGWMRDLGAIIDYLWGLPGLDRSHLSLVGFSGGAAVSVCVAARDRRVSGVVALACPADFTSLLGNGEPQKMVDHFREIGAIRDAEFPQSAEQWFNGFRLVSAIGCVSRITPRPLLLVHGDSDDTVPVDHAYRLYQRAGEPKQLVIIDGAGHRLRHDERAVVAVLDWLKRQRQE